MLGIGRVIGHRGLRSAKTRQELFRRSRQTGHGLDAAHILSKVTRIKPDAPHAHGVPLLETAYPQILNRRYGS